jgi:hypothetical protein
MSQRSSGGRSGGAGGAASPAVAAVASPRGTQLASPRRARAAAAPPAAAETAIDLTLDSDDDAAPARGAPARAPARPQPARRAAAPRESQDDCVIVAEVVPPEAAAKRAAKSAVLDLTKDDDPLLALLPNGAPTDGAVRFHRGATLHASPRPRGQPPWGGALPRARRGVAFGARTLVS